MNKYLVTFVKGDTVKHINLATNLVNGCKSFEKMIRELAAKNKIADYTLSLVEPIEAIKKARCIAKDNTSSEYILEP